MFREQKLPCSLIRANPAIDRRAGPQVGPRRRRRIAPERAAQPSQAAEQLARCTLASLVPTQLAALLDDPAWRSPARLRAVLRGGAAAPLALLERAAARGVPFLTTYGMTESLGQLATAPPDRAGDPAAPLVPLPGVAFEAGSLAAQCTDLEQCLRSLQVGSRRCNT